MSLRRCAAEDVFASHIAPCHSRFLHITSLHRVAEDVFALRCCTEEDVFALHCCIAEDVFTLHCCAASQRISSPCVIVPRHRGCLHVASLRHTAEDFSTLQRCAVPQRISPCRVFVPRCRGCLHLATLHCITVSTNLMFGEGMGGLLSVL